MGTQIETKPVEQTEMGIESVRDQFYNAVNFNHAMEPRIAKKLNLQPAPMPSTGGAGPSTASADQLWGALGRAELDQSRARRSRIVAFARSEPAYASFGVLRTKVLKSLRLNNWTTVAITSPEPGCGKSVLAVNLAFSMAKLQNCRVALLDLDFRRPQISAILGPEMARPTADFLEGQSPIEGAFVRYGDNLAVSAGRHGIKFPAELLQSQSARAAMVEVRERLGADVVLLDLPPVLGSDDVLAFLPNVDCTLLVVGAGLTSIAQLRRCEQELASETNLLGMVLNKCRHGESHGYY
jgi:Mrp family chromosome partitioning ATPase